MFKFLLIFSWVFSWVFVIFIAYTFFLNLIIFFVVLWIKVIIFFALLWVYLVCTGYVAYLYSRHDYKWRWKYGRL